MELRHQRYFANSITQCGQLAHRLRFVLQHNDVARSFAPELSKHLVECHKTEPAHSKLPVLNFSHLLATSNIGNKMPKAQAAQLTTMTNLNRSHLSALPAELLVEIFSHLDPVHAACLGLSSHVLYLTYRSCRGKLPGLDSFTYECPVPGRTRFPTACTLHSHRMYTLSHQSVGLLYLSF